MSCLQVFFVFQAEDGIRYGRVTGVQTCALPISAAHGDCDRLRRRHVSEHAVAAGRDQPAAGERSARAELPLALAQHEARAVERARRDRHRRCDLLRARPAAQACAPAGAGGRSDGATRAGADLAVHPAVTPRERIAGRDPTFWARMTTPTAAIHATLMRPTPASTSISPAQQTTQSTPWTKPECAGRRQRP